MSARTAPGERVAAFFDVDKTLLPGSSLFPLAVAMHRSGHLRRLDLVRLGLDQARYRLGRREHASAIGRVRSASLEAIAGHSRRDLLAVGRAVVRDTLRPRLYPEAVSRIESHRRWGHLVFLASSSPEDFVSMIGDELGTDGVVGTRAEVSEDGIYTGRLEGGLAHGAEKARRVRELADDMGISLTRAVAYSDSVNDLPLLLSVGHPIAVNPDRELARVARTRGWRMLRFSRAPADDAARERPLHLSASR